NAYLRSARIRPLHDFHKRLTSPARLRLRSAPTMSLTESDSSSASTLVDYNCDLKIKRPNCAQVFRGYAQKNETVLRFLLSSRECRRSDHDISAESKREFAARSSVSARRLKGAPKWPFRLWIHLPRATTRGKERRGSHQQDDRRRLGDGGGTK